MCDCEMPSAYGHDIRKARKQHKCCECFGAIPTGEYYHYHHGVWDGRGASFKVCCDCELLRKEMDKDSRWDEKTPFGYIGECLLNSIQGSASLICQFVGIKRKRGAEIREHWLRHEVQGKLELDENKRTEENER